MGGEQTYNNVRLQDLSPSCAAGLILAVSRRYAVYLRDFLSRYVTNRVYFGVLMVRPNPARAEKALI